MLQNIYKNNNNMVWVIILISTCWYCLIGWKRCTSDELNSFVSGFLCEAAALPHRDNRAL